MKKKILLSILCICMVLTMMPTVGYAVEKPVGDLYVNGVLIYSSKGGDPGTVAGVKFDIPSSTLTLTNANITNGVCGGNPEIAGIYSEFPLTINLEGTENKISIAPQSGKDSFGIKAESTLTIKGGGNLTIDSNNPAKALYCGIRSINDLTISGGNITSKGEYGIKVTYKDGERKLIISGGTTSVIATGTSKYGIYCIGTINIQDAERVDATGPKGAIVSYREIDKTGDGITTSGMGTEIGGSIVSLNPDKWSKYTTFTNSKLTYESKTDTLNGASGQVILKKVVQDPAKHVTGLTLPEITTAETLNLNEKVQYSPVDAFPAYKEVTAWLITDDGGTGATITEDDLLYATKPGKITLDASVNNRADGPQTIVLEITVKATADFSVATKNGKCNFDSSGGICYIMAAGKYEISNRDPKVATDQGIYVNSSIAGDVEITLGGVNIKTTVDENAISSDSPGKTTLILKDNTINRFISDKDSGGIDIADLVIKCEHSHVAGHVCDEHCGSLEAYSDDFTTTEVPHDGNGAGIGGDGVGALGTDITIEGGNIIAGSGDGAGIGGGAGGSTVSGGDGIGIKINGGNVTATSTNGAAIGGGAGPSATTMGQGKDIVISGGRVNTNSGASVVIGGGAGSADNKILGGSVNVSGGSPKLAGFAPTMQMYTYTFAGQNNKQVSELKDSKGIALQNFFNTNYQSDNIRTDESGKIYIWHQGNQVGNTAVCNDSGNIYKSDATGNMTISGHVEYDITVTNGTATLAKAAAGDSVSITAAVAPSGKVFDKWTTSDGVTFANANASTTTFTMPVKAVTVTATYKKATYALTVEHGTGDGRYEANASMEIVANEPAIGKVFDKWESSNGGTFTDENASTTTFTMPANATTVTATYKKAPATVTSVTVTPNTAKVEKGETQQFKATVTGANDPAQTVTWAVIGGGAGTIISETGLLTVAADETATSLTVTATSTVDTSKSDTATVTPFTKYDLTVTDGTGSGRYAEGAIVTIKAEPLPSGKIFDKWTTSDGITFAKDTDATTTFTMPAKAVTVTATYKDVPITVTSVAVTPDTANVEKGKTQQFAATVTGTGNLTKTVTWAVTGGKIGTSISSTGLLTVAAGETATKLTVTATSTDVPTKFGTATVTVTAPSTGGGGGYFPPTPTPDPTAPIQPKEHTITNADGTKTTVILFDGTKAGTLTKGEALLSAEALAKIAAVKGAGAVVATSTAIVQFDQKALQAITGGQTKGNIKVIAEIVNPDTLTPEEKALLGDNALIIDLSVENENGKVTDFNGGTATVVIKIPAGVDPTTLGAVYIKTNGKLEKVEGKVVMVNGVATFQFVTNHFSKFAVLDKATIDKAIAAQDAMAKDKLVKGVKATKLAAIKAVAKKSNVTVTWKKSKGYKVDGYQIWKSSKKTTGYKMMAKRTGQKYKNTYGLKAGKTYYYKVRGFREIDGKIVYTKWAQAKVVAK